MGGAELALSELVDDTGRDSVGKPSVLNTDREELSKCPVNLAAVIVDLCETTATTPPAPH